MSIADVLIGKNMKAHPDALGLYIGLDEMYIAQSSHKDGSVVLESLLRVPISDVDHSKLKPLDLNEGFFSEENWLETLNKVAARKKWKNTQVVVSLSSSFSLVRHFVIPTVIERKHWPNAIPLQARKYIHFPFEKMVHSYYAYEFETAASKQKRLGVIFTMTTKSIIEKLEKGLKSVGLDLVAVEPAAFSLSRAYIENDKEAVNEAGRIYSFFGTDMASFVFTNQNSPVLVREVEIAGSSPAERRRFEITNCTEFISKQLERDPFEEAVIMGVDTDNWIPLLEADSRKPVRKWNLREVYGIETKSAAEIAAIGASCKFYDTKSPDVDFIKRNRLSDYEFNAGLMCWKIMCVIAVILILLMIKHWWGVHSDEQRLVAHKKQHADVLPDFAGLTAQQISDNLNRLKNQNSNLEGLIVKNSTTPVLSDLVGAIPTEAWITKLSYKESFPPKPRDNMRALAFSGSIKTGDPAKNLAVGKQFEEKLNQMPAIKSVCGNQQIELKYKDLALSGDAENAQATSRGSNTTSGKNQEISFEFACGQGGSSR